MRAVDDCVGMETAAQEFKLSYADLKKVSVSYDAMWCSGSLVEVRW